MWLWKKQKEQQKVQTPFGEFVKDKDWNVWKVYVEAGGFETEVIANDVDGQPDPHLFHLLPYISENLPYLEAVARQAVSKLSLEHDFYAITSSGGEEDFSLAFVYSNESWGETADVYFKDNAVVDWLTMD